MDERRVRFSSFALRNKKMNRTRENMPGTSVSKNPRAVLWMYPGDKARKSAASKPTGLPPKSLPTKYSTRQVSAPTIAGRIEAKVIRSMFTPKIEMTEYRVAAVMGNPGSERDMSNPCGYQSCWNTQGSG